MLWISGWKSLRGAARAFIQSSALLMLVAALALSSAYGQTRGDGRNVVDSASRSEGRPAGGGGGQDIIVFDIVDSAANAAGRPAGGGVGGDIIVFDIVDSYGSTAQRTAQAKVGKGVLILSAGYQFFESGRVLILGESELPGVYEVLVDSGDSVDFGLVWLPDEEAIKLGVMILL